MTHRKRSPRFFWRLLKFPPRLLYALGLGPVYGRIVLLLTTTGRKSGLPRVTPLQYEEVEGAIYVGAARGQRADWFRNIVANPNVEVRLKSRRFHGVAKPITDPHRIADFLELRLRRHPKMMGAMLRAAGLPSEPTRAQLMEYVQQRALVAIRPIASELNMPQSGDKSDENGAQASRLQSRVALLMANEAFALPFLGQQ